MEFAATSPHQVTARVVAQTIPRALWFWRTVRCISHHLIVALPTSECLAALVSVRQLCCCFKGVPETRGCSSCPSRHDSPGGTRHRVGQSHGHKLERSRGQHHPGPVGKRGLRLTRRHPVEGGVGAKHQQDAQMPVAKLRDSPQPGLAAGCVLFWHEIAVSPANSRPQANLPAAVTLAQRQAAICGPIPGMVARLTLVLSRRWAARTAVSSLPISEPRLSSAATMGASAVGIAGGRRPIHHVP